MVCFESAVMVPAQRLQELRGIVEVWVRGGSSQRQVLIAAMYINLFVAQVSWVMSKVLSHVVSQESSASQSWG